MNAVAPTIGGLTERVQLLRRTTTAEPEGGEVAVFTPIATVWARVRRLSVRALFETDAHGRAITHGVVLRHRTDIGAGDRMVWRGVTLAIAAAGDLDGRRVWLSCQCIEKAVTG